MRNIMIFQHVGHEPLGTLNPALKAAGFRIRYVNFGRDPGAQPSLEGYNGLIVLGGPMGVYEANQHPHLTYEKKQIELALKMDIPVLGICLGSQLIADVLGAAVRKAPTPEVGWHPLTVTEHAPRDPLFMHFARTERIFQLHGDTFEPPKACTHLAFSPLYEGQAYRYGQKVYGLQFHLEVDQPMIERWMKRPENLEMARLADPTFDPARLLTDTHTHMARGLALAERAWAQFIELFGLPERPIRLGSEHGKPWRR